MRTRTKWMVAGGAAAFVLTPVVAVSASTPLDQDLQRSGVVVDVKASTTKAPAARPAPEAPAAEASLRPGPEPSGKKTVSAESPVSPHSAASPVSPKTPG